MDLTGMKFGNLFVKRKSEIRRNANVMWECLCDCGQQTLVRTNYLKTGHTSSCGCLNNRTTHNMSHSRPYRIYDAMLGRCYRKSNVSFKNYGERGITVSDEWRESFENFWKDMNGSYSDNLSLDRIDNSKGYSKENCKWSTKFEQCRNTRANRYIEIGGITKTLTDWANHYGVNGKSIYSRIKSGWDPKDAVTKPFRKIREVSA